LKILLPDAAMYFFSSIRCRGFGATPVLVASSFRNVQRVGKHSALYSNTPAFFVEEYWLFQRIRHFLVLIVKRITTLKVTDYQDVFAPDEEHFGIDPHKHLMVCDTCRRVRATMKKPGEY